MAACSRVGAGSHRHGRCSPGRRARLKLRRWSRASSPCRTLESSARSASCCGRHACRRARRCRWSCCFTVGGDAQRSAWRARLVRPLRIAGSVRAPERAPGRAYPGARALPDGRALARAQSRAIRSAFSRPGAALPVHAQRVQAASERAISGSLRGLRGAGLAAGRARRHGHSAGISALWRGWRVARRLRRAVALEVFLRKPELFAALGCVQAALSTAAIEHYAERLSEPATSAAPRAIQLVTSSFDPFREAASRLAKRLSERGVSVTFTSPTGPTIQRFLREVGTLEMLLFQARALHA